MPLSPGARLGPYEVSAHIGKGGMGEIYKGRDTRLDRTVAIKVIPERFSERTQREARAISALNHPHICQLYDVGPDYLVMEYIEGKPVSGPMPVAQALRLASQMASALDAAHAKGIVHRDLKPDNILVTTSGIKLLDFGLAKLAPATTSQDETETLEITREGTIVGTLRYMSPEQLQGEEADARSDIFAFGAVLYEMLTGRKAFPGATQASIITAIMSAEPAAISNLQPGSGGVPPPALERVVRRCLAKDPAARWQTVRDLGEELKWIAEGGSLAQAAPVMRGLLPWILATILATLVTGLLVLTGILKLPRKPEAARILRLQIDAGHVGWHLMDIPVISPDGSRIAFTGTDEKRVRHLWIRPISFFQYQMVPGTEGAYRPFWSPDGKQIGFAANSKLQRVDLAGGALHVICDLGQEYSLYTVASWSPAGVIVFGSTGALNQVSWQGGEPRPATRLDASRGEMRHVWPQFLPDGRHFLYLAVSQRSEDSAIYVASLDSQEIRRVMPSTLGAAFAEPDLLLYLRGGTLAAQPFDWKSARLTGAPVSLSERVFSWNSSYFPVSSFSVSGNTMVYRPGGLSKNQLVWFDRKGKRLGLVGEPADYSNPALSPDGQRIAVGRSDLQATARDVWILDGRGGSMRLTFDPKDDFNPLWSPDGARIAFSSDRKGVRDVYLKPANGVGHEELLLGSAVQKSVEDWSPDGKLILFNSVGAVWAAPIQGGRNPFLVLEGPRSDQSKLSPDGHWIAYRSSESGRDEVYVQGFPVAGAKWQISTAGGMEPNWRRDVKEMYFTNDNKLMAVDVKGTAGGFEHGAPRVLFDAPFAWEIRRNRYVPASDGQRFLVLTTGEEGAASPIHVVLNWKAEVKR